MNNMKKKYFYCVGDKNKRNLPFKIYEKKNILIIDSFYYEKFQNYIRMDRR